MIVIDKTKAVSETEKQYIEKTLYDIFSKYFIKSEKS